MALVRQLLDLFLAGAIAALITIVLAPVFGGASLIAVMVATMYYFSRYPWGASEETGINDAIDSLYDRILP